MVETVCWHRIRRFGCALGALLLAGCALTPGAAPARLTWEDVLAQPKAPPAAPAPRWSEDGTTLERGVGAERMRLDPRTAARTWVPDPEPPAADLDRAIDQLAELAEVDREEAQAAHSAGIVAGGVRLIQLEADLFALAEGAAPIRLTDTEGEEELPSLSPDGRFVSYVRESDLYWSSTAEAAETRLTEDGGETRLNGKLDWVYQEEIYGRGAWHAHWWSPKSDRLAFLSLDESEVPHYWILDHRGVELEQLSYPYPHPGEPNPKAALWIAAPGAPPRSLDLSRYGAEFLIVFVAWIPDGRLAFGVQDRVQTWLEVNVADPESLEWSTVLREESLGAWVESFGPPHWLESGAFLWSSERDGKKRIYHYPATGGAGRALTPATRNVAAFVRADEKRGEIYYTAYDERGLGIDLFRARWAGADGTGAGDTQLTSSGGTHAPLLDGDCGFFIDQVSSLRSPSETRLCDRDGRVLEVLVPASPEALARTTPPELLSIPTSSGVELDALLWRPRNFDARRRYPLLVRVYGGPAAPVVQDRWYESREDEFLLQEGVAVLRVNNRTSSRRGRADVDPCYLDLGREELKDLEEALRWLARESWLDRERIAISGYSYGGFLVVYALTHSRSFALGIAGGGVYDWRLYDSIYTERYMRTPADNPEGYRTSSCLESADRLHGELLLLHGALDDNVHMHNTLALVDRLVRAGKQYELVVYPGASHSIAAEWGHLITASWRAIERHLLDRRPVRP